MSGRTGLDIKLDALATLSPAQLKEEWQRSVRTPVPRLSPSMLRLALGYELQVKMSRAAQVRLERRKAGSVCMPTIVPGMRLVREWQGQVHVVTVGEDGRILWNDREWTSLSAVARAISGIRWSGPAFFGLTGKRAA